MLFNGLNKDSSVNLLYQKQTNYNKGRIFMKYINQITEIFVSIDDFMLNLVMKLKNTNYQITKNVEIDHL